MIYLKYFENHEGYSDAVSEELLEYPNVSVCKTQKHVHYSKVPPIKWVDLGLDSGTLWANISLGAKSETDYGLGYQWGGDQAYTIEEILDNASTASSLPYKYYDEATSAYTKYNETDEKFVLEPMDDMAFIKATDGTHLARTPEIYDVEELYSGTTQDEVTINGIPCIQFTSTANGNSILFPMLIDPEHPTTPFPLTCWTSMLSSNSTAEAVGWNANSELNINNTALRRFPYFIRPVAHIMAPNLSETLSGKGFTGETITITNFTENEQAYIQYSLYKLGVGSTRPPLELYLYSDNKGKYMYGERRGYDWTFRFNALYEIASITIEEAIQPQYN